MLFRSPYARFNRADIDERLENFLEDNDLRNHIYHNLYPKFLEGIFEQIFYSLKNSRIYDQQNYYPNLSARVAGRSFQTPEGCFTNRFNVSQFGILSFEKIVTDELSKQITGQLADPENSPYNLDYDDLGPIEKAIQNVCIIGFVRICLVELLLKGALTYSIWDLEGVMSEDLYKDFVQRFVEYEVNKYPGLDQKWEEAVCRITGFTNANQGLKKLVSSQLLKLQKVSKLIYNNAEGVDYYNWFATYFIPQSEISRKKLDLLNDVGNDRIPHERTPGWPLDEDMGNHFIWEHPFLDEGNILYNFSGTRLEAMENLTLAEGDGRRDLNPYFYIPNGRPGSFYQSVTEQTISGNDPFMHEIGRAHV